MTEPRARPTAELALALPLLVAVTVGLVWLLAVGAAQVRVVDAARETARAAARGDASGRGGRPRGCGSRRTGSRVTRRGHGRRVRVTARPAARSAGPGGLFGFLPGVTVHAEAVAALEAGAVTRPVTRSRTHGSGARRRLFVVACVGVLLLVGAALGVVAAMVRAHRQAQAAADLAALAGAVGARLGAADPCAAGAAIAAGQRRPARRLRRAAGRDGDGAGRGHRPALAGPARRPRRRRRAPGLGDRGARVRVGARVPLDRAAVVGARRRVARARPSGGRACRLSRRCRSDRLVPNFRSEKPHRIAAPAATPIEEERDRVDVEAEQLRACRSAVEARAATIADARRGAAGGAPRTSMVPSLGAVGAEQDVEQPDRPGLVERVVLVAALGRLDARRAALGAPARPRWSRGSRSATPRAARKPALGEAGAAGVAVVDEDGQQAGVRVQGRRDPADVPAVAGREERQQADRAVLGGVRGARAGRPRPGRPRRARASGTVHHTAQVRRVRSGRSSGSSPSTSPPGWRRLRNDTTWWETSTSPNDSRQPAPVARAPAPRRS